MSFLFVSKNIWDLYAKEALQNLGNNGFFLRITFIKIDNNLIARAFKLFGQR